MFKVRFQMYLLTAVLAFVTNLVYFAIDEVANQLETPFGRDENDIDFERMLRRIDKHTAAQLALRLGRPVPHFDLYPETQATWAEPVDSTTDQPSSLVARAYRCTIGRLLSSVTTGVATAGNDQSYYLEIETARIEAAKVAAAEAAAAEKVARSKLWQAAAGAAMASGSDEAPSLRKLISQAKLQQASEKMRSCRELAHAVGVGGVLICGLRLEEVTRDMVQAAAFIQAHYRGNVCRRQQQAAMAGSFRTQNATVTQ